jgi:tetratricopeptide (TPR) repeat protein
MILHWVHTEMGTPERERYRDLALPIFEEVGDLEYQGKTLNNLGIDAYWSGRWDEAVELYERGREALERVGDVIEAAVLRNNVAEIRSDQGRLDEAEQQFREVLATLRGAEFWQGVGLVYSNLGRVLVRRGDTEGAARLFERSRQTLSRVGADTKVLELETREAERLVAAGEPEAALALAGEIRETIRRRHEQPAHLALTQRLAALAKLQMGDVDGARIRLRESVEIARSVAAVYEEALSLEALGRCGGPGAAEAAAQAAELLNGLGVVAVSLPAQLAAA